MSETRSGPSWRGPQWDGTDSQRPGKFTMRANVLFVEDEEALRMTVGDRLRSEGYGVECAANGDEGYEKATQLPFDLIILDVMLPKKSGFDVCRDIRKAGLITPILMLTARGETRAQEKGL